MDLELRHLRAFAALVDEMNYTRAAAELHISQPALTRTIQQLERILECQLVTRTSRALSVTDAGRSFAEHCQQILTAIEVAQDEMRISSTVRVAFAWLLPEWFTDTTRTYENGGGRITLHRLDDPVRALQRGEVDIAIVRRQIGNRPPQIPEITWRAVASEKRLLAVATTSDLATRQGLHWDDLASEPLIINVISGTTTEDSWKHPDPDRVVVRCNNFDEWIELTAAGRGISAATEAVRARAPHPGVTYREIPGIPPSTVYVAWRDRTPPLRSIARFLDVTLAAHTASEVVASDRHS